MMVFIDIFGDVDKCGSDCEAFLAKWSAWCAQFKDNRLALIKVDGCYSESLDRKSRQMITKARNRGYYYCSFNYNDRLQDIYEINTSKEMRQGKVMSDSYLEYPTAVAHEELQRCDTHKYVRIGGFKDNKLYAYCAVALLNEFAVLNTIIGHADALTDGIMNGLINYLVDFCIATDKIRYLNYLTIESSGESLQAFKRSVGFESYGVKFL